MAELLRIRRKPAAPASKFAGIRKYPRHTAELEVLVLDEEGWEIPFESINLSAGGVFLRSDLLFEVGQVHTMLFRVPGGQAVVRRRARVVRTETFPQGVHLRFNQQITPGMAYEFLADEGEQAELEALLAAS